MLSMWQFEWHGQGLRVRLPGGNLFSPLVHPRFLRPEHRTPCGAELLKVQRTNRLHRLVAEGMGVNFGTADYGDCLLQNRQSVWSALGVEADILVIPRAHVPQCQLATRGFRCRG